MTHAASPSAAERAFDRLETATERVLRNAADGDDETLSATAAELLDVVAELEDVIGTADLARLPDALAGAGGESQAAADLEAFVDEVKPRAKNAAIQQRAASGAEAARTAVVEGHAALEDLYESKQRGSGYAGRRPVSKNPTAVSSVPYGPLPAGISARVSTVPANVRGAAVDAPPRVYARRWRTAGSRGAGTPKRR